MELDVNRKTFNYMFGLFIRHGESNLGRKLTNPELQKLKVSLAQKCEKIPKKDIVREIYNLRLAELEKKNGHLNSLKRFKLKQEICKKTNSPMRFKSSRESFELASTAAQKLTEFHSLDNWKRTLKKPSMEEKRNLKNSYIKNHFHYKAPLSTSQKIARGVLVGTVALGLIGGAFAATNSGQTHEPRNPEPTTISATQTTEPTKQTLDSTINSSLDQDFRIRYAQEYNHAHNTSMLSADGIVVEPKHHSYLYVLHVKDENGNPVDVQVTHGSLPAETQRKIENKGYSYDIKDDQLLYVTKSTDGVFYEASNSIGGDPVLPGEDIDNLDDFIKGLDKHILSKMSHCYYYVDRVNHSTPNRYTEYLENLKNYYRENPDNVLPDNVVLEESDIPVQDAEHDGR